MSWLRKLFSCICKKKVVEEVVDVIEEIVDGGDNVAGELVDVVEALSTNLR